MKIKYKKLDNFISPPVRAYGTDAGADVLSPDTYLIPPRSRMAIPLGFALEIPEGYMGIIVTKSSTFKKGLYSHIPPIDCGYTGECHALIENVTDNYITINKGDKIAQLIILPMITPSFEEVKELSKSERGVGGFGSTSGRMK